MPSESLPVVETSPHGDAEPGDADRQQSQPVDGQQAVVGGAERIVDRELHDARHDQAQPHLRESEDEAEDHQPLVATRQGEDAPEGLHPAEHTPLTGARPALLAVPLRASRRRRFSWPDAVPIRRRHYRSLKPFAVGSTP